MSTKIATILFKNKNTDHGISDLICQADLQFPMVDISDYSHSIQ